MSNGIAPVLSPQDVSSTNVDQIREILFGADKRQIDQRFEQLRDFLEQRTDELRQEVRRRMDTFELFFKKEIETLRAEVAAERADRSRAASDAQRDARQALDALGQRLDNSNQQMSAAQTALRADLLNQCRQILDQIADLDQQWKRTLDQRFGELGRQKTDRTALAAILGEMAARLDDGKQS